MRFTARRYVNLLLSVAFVLSISACSTTKFVPEGSYLLDKMEVQVDSKELSRDALKKQVRQRANLTILGIWKFHLGVYNLSSKRKDDGWLKRIGEAPAVYQPYMKERSVESLRTYLQNKGYYNATVIDSVIYHDRQRKVELIYHIHAGEPYRVRNYNYNIEDKNIAPLIYEARKNQKVNEGDLFDVDKLNEERKRLATLMKNQGYYAFSTDHVQFLADSTLNSKQVDLTIEIADETPMTDEAKVQHHRKWVIKNYEFNTDYTPRQLVNDTTDLATDTIFEPPYTFVFKNELRYRPDLLENLNRMKDGRYYSLYNVERTFRSLNQIQQFRLVNMNFEKVPELGNDSVGVLDAHIQLAPLPRQGFTVELEGTNSSGNLGVASNLSYQHRNLFRGAELLNITLKGAYERQQNLVSDATFNFDTREVGIEATLTLPRYLTPFKSKRFFNYQVPQTVISTGFNYQRRLEYTRTIANMRFGYQWKSKHYRTNYLNLLDLNMVNLLELNEDFINSIRDLYIRSSFTDHLIMAANYTLVDNTQATELDNTYHYFKWSVESAGNVLGLASNLFGRSKFQDVDEETGETVEYYRALGSRFAQYLKTDLEFRYGYQIDEANSLVSRAFLGVALPYGNFDVMPFEKQYFGGGANGIRGWQVRTLGPGTYKAGEDEYPNQSADIKLEANLEYRYHLIGFVEGAFFLDAGNIWAINSRDNREGATFKFKNFYKEIAMSAGTGLRFDFNYFVFRLDLGVKMRDPSLPSGKRFIWGNYPLSSEHLALSFAIGYPF